jgi:glycosyltransferase involved in cell wall biosynthesis
MNILLTHSNFPAQFKVLAQVLGANPDNDVYFLTQNPNGEIKGVKKILYESKKTVSRETHPYLYDTEWIIGDGQRAYEACAKIKQQGFRPDVIFGYASWGTAVFLKDLYPDVPLGLNAEWYYKPTGSDCDFAPNTKLTEDNRARIRVKNSIMMYELAACDGIICPTNFQKSQFPTHFKSSMTVVHEGIDTSFFKPSTDKNLVFKANNTVLTKDSEIVTYATRGLEVYRGFPQFIEALSLLQKERPNLHAVIAGADHTFYGAPPEGNKTCKELCLEAFPLDLSRVHFVGQLGVSEYLKLLQISKAHVYFTYPFVLSWSMLEAMACETPMICSATAPVQEVITDGYNGQLVDFFDASQLAQKITNVLNKPKSFRRMQKNARKTVVENYEIKSCLRKRLTWLSNLSELKELNP